MKSTDCKKSCICSTVVVVVVVAAVVVAAAAAAAAAVIVIANRSRSYTPHTFINSLRLLSSSSSSHYLITCAEGRLRF